MKEARSRRPSVPVHIRLNADDQENLAAVIEAGLADNTTDAIRCALDIAAKAARRLLTKRSDI